MNDAGSIVRRWSPRNLCEGTRRRAQVSWRPMPLDTYWWNGCRKP